MTSHYRHRRQDNPDDPFVAPMERGEIAVNTANRQVAVGDPGGQPIALIAVRYFDERSQYALNDFVVNGGFLYNAKEPILPGPFNAAQWHLASHDPGDTTDLSNYLQKAGGTMTGPLVLAGDPATDLEAATKLYVDNAAPPPPAAIGVPFTPGGNVQASNVQSALVELDDEKVAKAGDTMTGLLTLSGPPTALLHPATKKYADDIAVIANSKVSKAGDTMVGNLNVNADIYANRTPNTGVIFLGSNSSHYLYFDGATYNLPGGALTVGGLMTSAGATINGTLTANQAANLNGTSVLHSDGYFGAGNPSKLQIYGDSAYPTIAFHAPGYFGANFGMNTDGNFYIGGWSFGAGNYYKVLTTRDGSMITAQRMVHIADYSHATYQGLVEPYSCCSITGMSSYMSFDGWSYGNYARYRQHQILIDGGWYAAGY